MAMPVRWRSRISARSNLAILASRHHQFVNRVVLTAERQMLFDERHGHAALVSLPNGSKQVFGIPIECPYSRR